MSIYLNNHDKRGKFQSKKGRTKIRRYAKDCKKALFDLDLNLSFSVIDFQFFAARKSRLLFLKI